ncbi:TIGR02221 family CRISPR-associated protein [Psychromonas arctica]|uniref:TIGR02221 family CRISPR-associated protein n=1 Tax=Psychromonas arctica TaxID=168275 RepID=UPI002FCFAF24
MAKVLVSLLGTGRKASGETQQNEYEGTDYLFEGKCYENETFIANPLIKHYGIDKIFFVGTQQSMWDNIADKFADEDEYLAIIEKKEAKAIDEGALSTLNQAIDKRLNSEGSKCFIVDDGENEEQLWKNFEKFLEIMENLNDGDELYLDITHLFRSISIMSFVMSDFIKNYKNVHLAGVFYGMLKSDEASLIINITLFFDLLTWAKAIKTLKDTGNGTALSSLINRNIDDKTLQNSFSDFSHALSISDLSAMQMSIQNLKGKMALFEQYDNKIINLIGKDLRAFINNLDARTLSKFQFNLARWYAKNNNYAMAYLSLTEGTISAICEKYELERTIEGHKEAKKIIREYGNWKKSSDEKQAIAKAYQKANNIRNNIAHKLSSDNRTSNSSPINSIENFDLYHQKLVAI